MTAFDFAGTSEYSRLPKYSVLADQGKVQLGSEAAPEHRMGCFSS